ncbi:MAG: B12-binding domain-containing radical SAM protein [Deltaproteobacteria bacterium]|nr:B12-binding domain-containing radical SAM protein [Deltaproteobacteria bacterium]
MKILFIVNTKDLGFEEPLGALYLSSAAKRRGHDVRAVENELTSVEAKIAGFRPDLLAMSVLTPSFPYLYRLLRDVKRRHKIPSIVGGPHATHFPEILKEEGIDYVFRGEGEISFLKFLDRFEKGAAMDDCENLSYMKDGQMRSNPLAPFVEDLDSVAFPDRELLGGYRQFTESDVRSVMASRGCPYQCSYCFNNQYQGMYKDLGKRLRLRSVDNVVAECKALKGRYGARMIHFFDDIFPFKPAWVEEFAEKYKAEVGLPFLTNTSFNVCSEQYVSALARAGCKCLLIGVETGNEYFREKILFRKMKNSMMVECAKLVHSHGIRIYTQNLIGLPHGSLELDIETLRVNIALKADYAGAYLCQPYPGTPIEAIAKEAGLFDADKEFNRSFYYSSKIKIADREKVERLRILFPIVVNFPALHNFIYLFLRFPSGPWGVIGKLLHGYKIKSAILRYNMSARSFINHTKLFFRRPINRMVLEEKAGEP